MSAHFRIGIKIRRGSVRYHQLHTALPASLFKCMHFLENPVLAVESIPGLEYPDAPTSGKMAFATK